MRTRELALFVCDKDLQGAYAKLAARKRRILDCARSMGAMDECPPALPVPVNGPALPGSRHLRQLRDGVLGAIFRLSRPS